MDLIRTAYGEFVPISGGPAWIKSDRYRIDARAESNTSPRVMDGPMLQALLEDRFKLKIRRETREVSIYTLTVAKEGSKLQSAKEGSCVSPESLQPGKKPCGMPMTRTKGPNLSTEIIGNLDEFAKLLGVTLGRPVVDRTGITGTFDFHLEFALDENTPNVRLEPSDEPPGPSIFTALQEQLGLKLASARGPAEFLVIDHVERPSEN
jgi:uncharacterized protein (TIGR03435 family)